MRLLSQISYIKTHLCCFTNIILRLKASFGCGLLFPAVMDVYVFAAPHMTHCHRLHFYTGE